jgi:O-antigen/teichoic acid export membrane protein
MLCLAAAGVAYGSVTAVFRAWPETVPAIVALETAGALALLAGTWQIARWNGGVSALLALAAAVQAVQLLAVGVCWRGAAGAGNVLQWPSARSTVALLRRALPFAISGLVANVQERLGPLMLGRLAGVGEVASFGAAWRIGSAARMVPQAALGGGLPVLAEEAARGRPQETLLRFERMLAIFAAAAAGAIALFAGPLVQLTYGKEFAPAASSLIWVGLGLWPFIVNAARRVGLYAAGREDVVVRFSLIALTVQAGACAALIPSFGAPGAALAMAAGEAAVWWPLRRHARARA